MKTSSSIVILSLFAAANLVGACTAPSEDDAPASGTSDLTGSPAPAGPITIEFHADGELHTSGIALDGAALTAITSQDPVSILYDTHRLKTCGLVAKGSPTAHLDVSWRLNGGAIQTRPIDDSTFTGAAGDTLATVTLGKLGTGNLEIWFHAKTAGCEGWDSASGHNYQFVVHKPTIGSIDFDSTRGHVPTTKSVPSGGLLEVTYGANRVPGCTVNIEEGQHLVVMHWRFDDQGDWQHASWNSVFGGTPPIVELPLAAHRLSMWFEATDGGHCHDYDSRDAQNYNFALE